MSYAEPAPRVFHYHKDMGAEFVHRDSVYSVYSVYCPCEPRDLIVPPEVVVSAAAMVPSEARGS